MKTIRQSGKFGAKLQKLKEGQESFEYNLLDISHPDFNVTESKCMPVQGFTQSLRNDVLNLKTHAEISGRSNLAANQIGILKRFFVIAQPDYLIKRQWINHNFKADQFQAFVNPRILEKDKFAEYDWEETACFPTIRFRKLRFHHIYVQYQNENTEQVQQELTGWESRLFQQSIDHLNGILPFCEVQNMLDSELLQDYQEDSLLLDEFKESKKYRLFGKEQKMSSYSQQHKPSDVTETVSQRQSKPQVFNNKSKKSH